MTSSSLWNDNLRIGLDSCDAQRRDLAALIEKLDQNSTHSNSHEYFLGQFNTLQVVVQEYFAREEAIMDALHVPAEVKKPHVAEHERILELFLKIYFESMEHTGKSAFEVYKEVRQAFSDHFRDTDSKLRYFVAINQ